MTATILSKVCIRRINGVRCSSNRASSQALFCSDHIHDTCIICSKPATMECQTCSEPLCSTCKHHDSFGH